MFLLRIIKKAGRDIVCRFPQFAFPLSESVFDVTSARQPAVERPVGQLLSCDDKYEFGVCECLDRDHLLVLDYQSLAGMHLHPADLNFAYCRY